MKEESFGRVKTTMEMCSLTWLRKDLALLGLWLLCFCVQMERQSKQKQLHGTVTQHYYQHQQGKETSTNPIAVFLLGLVDLLIVENSMEMKNLLNSVKHSNECVWKLVESGKMTKTLLVRWYSTNNPPRGSWLTTEEFLMCLQKMLRRHCPNWSFEGHAKGVSLCLVFALKSVLFTGFFEELCQQ